MKTFHSRKAPLGGLFVSTATQFFATWMDIWVIAAVIVENTFPNVESVGMSAVNHAAGKAINIH